MQLKNLNVRQHSKGSRSADDIRTTHSYGKYIICTPAMKEIRGARFAKFGLALKITFISGGKTNDELVNANYTQRCYISSGDNFIRCSYFIFIIFNNGGI